MYGLWRRPDQDVDPIRATLLEQVAPALLDLGVTGLRVCVEEPAGKAYQVGAEPRRQPARRVRLALDRQLRQPRRRTRRRWPRSDAQTYGWIVAESEARCATASNRTWPDGEQSPGLSITTFFDKKEGVDDDDFYRIWHGEHTPLSFEIHPLWLYVRNQVLRSITPGAPTGAGHRLRGGAHRQAPARLQPLLRLPRRSPSSSSTTSSVVNDHMDTFGNTATLQCVPMREWIFRTLST